MRIRETEGFKDHEIFPVHMEPSRLSARLVATVSRPNASLEVDFAASFIIICLLILLYQSVALKLVLDWYQLPDYSHGFLIPFFVLYLLWDKRHVLSRVPLAPSWAGFWVIVPALGLFLVGVFGADLFLSRVSFVALAAGLIWVLFGAAMLREMRFVLFVLLLAIPFPTLVMNQITFPLQLLASRFASSMLALVGVPVLRDGNVIQLPSMQLEVAEACSGIRSLMSLFTVAIIYGYFTERTVGRKIVLAFASFPIAVAANVVRIFGTGMCVQYWNPDKAVGFFHEFSGWLMFLVSLVCLYGVQRLMSLLSPRDVTRA